MEIRRFFDYSHLPPHLAEVSAPFCDLAKRRGPGADAGRLPARAGGPRRAGGAGGLRALRVLSAVLALTACGPVTTTTEPTPVETLGQRAVAASLRVALTETCRATVPAVDAHPAHRIAWAIACGPVLQPAAGVPLPPSPPATPPATLVTDAAP